MSYYDCRFDLIIRVVDPNGIQLNENIDDMIVKLNELVKKEYPNSVVLPKSFEVVE